MRTFFRLTPWQFLRMIGGEVDSDLHSILSPSIVTLFVLEICTGRSQLRPEKLRNVRLACPRELFAVRIMCRQFKASVFSITIFVFAALSPHRPAIRSFVGVGPTGWRFPYRLGGHAGMTF